MPENENQDVPETGMPTPVESAKERFERERLSRRQALKRLGMTSAMAAFALFSVDDLARMVGKAMQQRAGDNKVVEQVAKEFQQAGIAFAGGTSNPCYASKPSGTLCQADCDCSGCNPNTLNTCCNASTHQFQCCAKSNSKVSCCGYVVGQIDPNNILLLGMCLGTSA